MPNAGYNVAFGIGVESTYGTAVAASLWARAESWNDDPSSPQIPIQALHNGRGQAGRSAVNTISDISGSYTIRGHYDGGVLATHLRAATGGTYSTSGVGPYKHDIGIAGTLPSVTLRPVYGTGVGGATELGAVIAGVKVDSLEATFSGQDSLMDISCNWRGSSYTSGAAGTPSYGTDNAILPQAVGTIAWNSGTWTPSSLTLSITNGLEDVRQLGSKTLSARYQVNKRTIRMTFSVLRESDAFQTAHAALTEDDAVVTITNGTDILKLTLYNARVVESVPHAIGDTSLVVETIVLEGRDDGTNDTLLIELTNGDTNAEDS